MTTQRPGLLARLYQHILTQPLLLLFLLPFAVVAFLNPAKVGLALWGISKLALFAIAGDHVDTWIFRKLTDENAGLALGTLWKRKAWIVAAAILAGALLP